MGTATSDPTYLPLTPQEQAREREAPDYYPR